MPLFTHTNRTCMLKYDIRQSTKFFHNKNRKKKKNVFVCVCVFTTFISQKLEHTLRKFCVSVFTFHIYFQD